VLAGKRPGRAPRGGVRKDARPTCRTSRWSVQVVLGALVLGSGYALIQANQKPTLRLAASGSGEFRRRCRAIWRLRRTLPADRPIAAAPGGVGPTETRRVGPPPRSESVSAREPETRIMASAPAPAASVEPARVAAVPSATSPGRTPDALRPTIKPSQAREEISQAVPMRHREDASQSAQILTRDETGQVAPTRSRDPAGRSPEAATAVPPAAKSAPLGKVAPKSPDQGARLRNGPASVDEAAPSTRTAAPPDQASTPPPPRPTVSPETDAGALLARLESAYASKDPDGFSALFTPGARVNEGQGQALIRSKYADLFNRASGAKLSIRNVRWRSVSSGRMVGSGTISVSNQYRGSGEWRHATGRLDLELVRGAGGFRIASMIYRLD
jgi:hypothetical protein